MSLDRGEVVPQAHPGPLDEGADELQEPRGDTEIRGDRQRREARAVREPAVGDLDHPGRGWSAELVRRQGHQALERLLGQPQALQVPLPPGAGSEGLQVPPLLDPPASPLVAIDRRKRLGVRQGGALGEGQRAVPVTQAPLSLGERGVGE